jgi:bifunctional non-homologous end joining protein LigD
MTFPEPMLLRSGRLPTSGDYAYEPKWDGFRALVGRNGELRVKSRRGWDMTSLVPELADLADGLAVDGELVAFGDDGLPSFPRLCDRMLHGRRRIDVMLIIFDVLAIDGRDVTRRPYWERRRLLEALALDGDHWSTTPSHEDGDALWGKVCELGLEGVVAKKRSGHYLPGRRGWIKIKNRAYWRYYSSSTPRGHGAAHAADEAEAPSDSTTK